MTFTPERKTCPNCQAEVVGDSVRLYGGLCKRCYDDLPARGQYRFLEIRQSEDCDPVLEEWAKVGWIVVSHASYWNPEEGGAVHTFTIRRPTQQ